jgi:hypothetical protein
LLSEVVYTIATEIHSANELVLTLMENTLALHSINNKKTEREKSETYVRGSELYRYIILMTASKLLLTLPVPRISASTAGMPMPMTE